MSCSYRRAFGYPPEFSECRRALFSCTWRWENGKKNVEAGKGNAMQFCQEADWGSQLLIRESISLIPLLKEQSCVYHRTPATFLDVVNSSSNTLSQKASQSTSRLWIALVCNDEISQSKSFSLKLKLTYTRWGQLHIDIETAKICEDGKML